MSFCRHARVHASVSSIAAWQWRNTFKTPLISGRNLMQETSPRVACAHVPTHERCLWMMRRCELSEAHRWRRMRQEMIRNEKEAKLNRWMQTWRQEGGEQAAKCVRLPASLSWVSRAFLVAMTTLCYTCNNCSKCFMTFISWTAALTWRLKNSSSV